MGNNSWLAYLKNPNLSNQSVLLLIWNIQPLLELLSITQYCPDSICPIYFRWYLNDIELIKFVLTFQVG